MYRDPARPNGFYTLNLTAFGWRRSNEDYGHHVTDQIP